MFNSTLLYIYVKYQYTIYIMVKRKSCSSRHCTFIISSGVAQEYAALMQGLGLVESTINSLPGTSTMSPFAPLSISIALVSLRCKTYGRNTVNKHAVHSDFEMKCKIGHCSVMEIDGDRLFIVNYGTKGQQTQYICEMAIVDTMRREQVNSRQEVFPRSGCRGYVCWSWLPAAVVIHRPWYKGLVQNQDIRRGFALAVI